MFKKAAGKKPEKQKETLPESISGIASVLVSGLFIITFVIQAFEIPTGSMENTLRIGDHVFVDRVTPTLRSWYMPIEAHTKIKHGDIIVFLKPSEPGLHLVKRIIGLPGDRIRLRDGVVYRNGEALNEPYLNPDHGYPNAYRDDFPTVPANGDPNVLPEWPLLMREHVQNGELVVPPDNYFGMGDNRANSLDSRYWGFIPQQYVIGRPLFIYWSFNTPPDQVSRTSWGDRVAFMLHIAVHFFDQTRWNRMFRMVR